MELVTLAERLDAAMKTTGVSRSALARECRVSAAAVTKWLKGGKMNADSLAKAARALGVRDEWLRTGKLPREREHAEEERAVDQVMELLTEIRQPLSDLLGAIDRLTGTQTKPHKRAS